jgi:Na+-transporting NADH:ubiquinone oxidoreductase subunit A
MSNVIKIRKGFDIKMKGEAEKVIVSTPVSETYVVRPVDFNTVIPRLLVDVGSEVKAGTPLFFNKKDERIVFCSPVSGEVVEVNRGEKRKLLEIKILADKELAYIDFRKSDPLELSREEIVTQMLESGVWPMIRQRPFNIIANPDESPKSIFISTFDSSPLAGDNDFIVHGHGAEFQAGINALSKLTDGKVNLSIRHDSPVSEVFTKSKNVNIYQVSGPHPAGNVGVQIHQIDPINKGDVIWFVNPQDVIIIGRLFTEGRYDATRVIAVAGSEIKHPRYHKTLIGTALKPLITDNVHQGNNRFISGSVLNGTKTTADGYMSFYDTQLTVIPEGNEPEFLGWLTPGFSKLSLSRTFFSWLLPGKKYTLDTNIHGEERAFVMTGEYESVFPFDIYPVHLIKAMMADDVEAMEALGIYEVSEEDFALCEFVCTSKIPVGDIVRRGIDLVREECA